MQVNTVSTQKFMFWFKQNSGYFPILHAGCLPQSRIERDKESMTCFWDKLCISIRLHFEVQSPECLELKSLVSFHAGGCFSLEKAPTAICVFFCMSHHTVSGCREAANLHCPVWRFFRVESGTELSYRKNITAEDLDGRWKKSMSQCFVLSTTDLRSF